VIKYHVYVQNLYAQIKVILSILKFLDNILIEKMLHMHMGD